MIPVLGIPILNRGDLLQRLVDSIDYPVNILHIVVNSVKEEADPGVLQVVKVLEKIPPEQRPFIKNVFWSYGKLYDTNGDRISNNLGVAGSWNSILKHYGAEYYMLVGNDIQFAPGDLKKFDDYITAWPDKNKKGVICGNHGFSCFALLAETITQVGYFDENIYPAYLEDCDYKWRCILADLDNEDVPDTHMIHGEAPSWGSSTIYSNKDFREKNGYTHSINFIYYNKKWGGDNGKEKFTSPYNDNTKPISYWQEPVIRVPW